MLLIKYFSNKHKQVIVILRNLRAKLKKNVILGERSVTVEMRRGVCVINYLLLVNHGSQQPDGS
jgi:hypothetical protein